MLSAKLFMGILLFWVTGQVIAVLFTGLYLSQPFLDVLTQGTAFNAVEISSAGTLTLPKASPALYISMIPSVLAWDYVWLAGPWSIVKVFLWPFSVGAIIGLVAIAAPALQGVFSFFNRG